MFTVQAHPDPEHRAAQITVAISRADQYQPGELEQQLKILLPHTGYPALVTMARNVALAVRESNYWNHLGAHTNPVTAGWGWVSATLGPRTDDDDIAFSEEYLERAAVHWGEALTRAMQAVLADLAHTTGGTR